MGSNFDSTDHGHQFLLKLMPVRTGQVGRSHYPKIRTTIHEQPEDMTRTFGRQIEGIMKQYQPQLGELLRTYRSTRFASQEAFAAAAEVDVRTVRRAEAGKSVRDSKMAAMCAAIGLDLRDLQLEALQLQEATNLKQASQKAVSKSSPVSYRDGHSPGFENISEWLDSIDERVTAAVGELKAPTRSDDLVSFSCRRLISSLSTLGIPLDIILLIVGKLPDELHETVSEDEFSTNHIRSCVARVISGLSTATIQATESYKVRYELASDDKNLTSIPAHEIKFDWVSRYARRYGSPDQAIQILERDGSSKRLDYDYLRNEMIPHVLRRILGPDFSVSSNKIISRKVIDQIARSTLEEFKRLSLYTIRYKTALRLIEDLAIHPPHPWMVTSDTKQQTLEYDLDRAVAHLEGLKDESLAHDVDSVYHYDEMLHHICSAILAIYSGFLGHRDTSSVHLLRHWLRTEEDNYLLWRNCDLRMIESDLAEIRLSKHDFSSLLKRMDLANRGAARKPRHELIAYGNQLLQIARDLAATRVQMAALTVRLQPGQPPSPDVFEAVARETIVTSLGCKRVAPLNGNVGLRAVLRTEKSLLASRSALTIFIFCANSGDQQEVINSIARAKEQLAEHRLAETCIILCVEEPQDRLLKAISRTAQELHPPLMIRAASVLVLREKMRSGMPTEDIIDDIVE